MSFVNYLIPIGLIAVTLVLLAGLANMLRGGEASLSQKLMRWRVGLQFATVVLVMLGFYLSDAMVKLTKIYTRSGDDAVRLTARALHDARIAAYGAVDETNAASARGYTKEHAALDGVGAAANDLLDLVLIWRPRIMSILKFCALRRRKWRGWKAKLTAQYYSLWTVCAARRL